MILLPVELHPFVRLVLDNVEIPARLASILEAGAFVAEAVAVAKEYNIALDRDALLEILRPDPLRGGPGGPAPIELDRWPPGGWHPSRCVPTRAAPAIDWLWIGDRPLTQPFFDDEVRTVAALPFNWLFRIRTTMPALIAGAVQEPEIPLGGLIYHMSRCGSTLLTQMLAAVPDHIVSSEPEPLDGVVRWVMLGGLSEADASVALRAIVAALGRHRGLGATKHFIKLDAWHAFSFPWLRAAFPDVPWVHLYRDAREVMVSAMQKPALHTVQGMLPDALLGFSPRAVLSREEFAARVLGGIGKAMVGNWRSGGGLVLAYDRIAEMAPTKLAAHFRVLATPALQASMAAATRRDAKDPINDFSTDVADKQSKVTPAIEAAIAHWMAQVQTALDELDGLDPASSPQLKTA